MTKKNTKRESPDVALLPCEEQAFKDKLECTKVAMTLYYNKTYEWLTLF